MSSLPTTMRDRPVGTQVFTGTSAEQALERVYDELGGHAHIVDVHRHVSGGLFGFFQREFIRIEAAPASDETDPAPPDDRPSGGVDDDAEPFSCDEAELPADDPGAGAGDAVRTGGPSQTAVDLVLAQLAEELSEGEVAPEGGDTAAGLAQVVPSDSLDGGGDGTPFADLLDQTMGGAPWAATSDREVDVTHVSTDAAVPVAQQLRVPAPSRASSASPGPLWSVPALVALGLPEAFASDVAAHHPQDDADWTHALSRELDRLCGPVPDGPALLVGPRAKRVAELSDVPLVDVGEMPPAGQTVAHAGTDRDAVRRYVHDVHDSRWVMVVAGGSGWRRLLFDGPDAVAWSGEDALADAVSVAFNFGVPLTVGATGGPSARLVDPLPMGLAVLLREQLEVHL